MSVHFLLALPVFLIVSQGGERHNATIQEASFLLVALSQPKTELKYKARLCLTLHTIT